MRGLIVIVTSSTFSLSWHIFLSTLALELRKAIGVLVRLHRAKSLCLYTPRRYYSIAGNIRRQHHKHWKRKTSDATSASKNRKVYKNCGSSLFSLIVYLLNTLRWPNATCVLSWPKSISSDGPQLVCSCSMRSSHPSFVSFQKYK